MDGKIKILNQSAISQMKVFVDKQNENKNLNNDKSIMPESKKIESTGENVSLDEINAIENINKTNTVKELNNEVLNSIEPDENIEKYLSTEQKEAIIEQFEKEYKKLLEDFETAKNSNGIISGAWDKFKNFTKIGAGSDKTLKEIENLKKEIENLKNNPESFSDCYKNITGSDLTLVSLNRTFDESSNNKTNASKSLEKYTEGQKMATDTIADITSGVAAVGAVAAASAAGIAAAPFTAGASLGLIAAGIGVAGTTGAAVKTGIKALDCAGNEKKYSLKNAAYDTITGAVNGAMSIFSAALGSTAGKAVMKLAGKEALETTVLKAGETTVKQTGKQIFIKTAATATEMTIDGGLSGMADALSRDIGENITGEADKGVKEIAKDTLKGTAGGALGGVFIGGAFKGASKLGEAVGNSAIGQKIGQKVQGLFGNNITDSINELTDNINKNITDELDNAQNRIIYLDSNFDYDSLMKSFSLNTKAQISEEITQETAQKAEKETFKNIADNLDFLKQNGIKSDLILQNANDYTQKELDAIVKLSSEGFNDINIFNFLNLNTSEAQFDNAVNLFNSGVKNGEIMKICEETSTQEADEIYNFVKKFNKKAKIDVKINTIQDSSNTGNFSSSMKDLASLDLDLDFDLNSGIKSSSAPEITSGGKIIKTTAEFNSGDDCVVQVIQTINPDGTIKIERNEKFVNEINSVKYPKYNSWNTDNGGSFQTTPYRFQDTANVYIDEQFEIITDKVTGEPVQILHTQKPENQYTFSNKTLYNLKDYSEDVDIIEAIKLGKLEGGQELSKLVQNPDGSTTYFENLSANGSTIKRDFTTKSNGIDYDYSFKINDENGAELLNLERSFEKISQNETRTTIDGQEITALFDDSTQTITLKDSNGKEVKIDIVSKTDENKTLITNTIFGDTAEVRDGIIENGSEKLWENCKNLPADKLYELNNIETWKLSEDLNSVYINGTKGLRSGEDSFIISHELGHQKDELLGINFDEELNKLYEEELSAFNSKHTKSSGGEYIEYFSQTSNAYGSGLKEVIAETNALLTYAGQKNFIISTRAQLLAQNFPKTISHIAKKLKFDF